MTKLTGKKRIIVGEYYINKKNKKNETYAYTSRTNRFFGGIKLQVTCNAPVAEGGTAKLYSTDNEKYLLKEYDCPGAMMYEQSIYSFIWKSYTNYAYNKQFCKIYEVSTDGKRQLGSDTPLLAIENRGKSFNKAYKQIENQISELDKLIIFLQIFHGFTFLLHNTFVEHGDITTNNVLLKVLEKHKVMRIKIFDKDIIICTKYLVTIIDFNNSAFLMFKSYDEYTEDINNISLRILSTILVSVDFRRLLSKDITGARCNVEKVKLYLLNHAIDDIYQKYGKNKEISKKIQEYQNTKVHVFAPRTLSPEQVPERELSLLSDREPECNYSCTHLDFTNVAVAILLSVSNINNIFDIYFATISESVQNLAVQLGRINEILKS